MAQRKSGYARPANEFFPTPPWVVDALAEHVNLYGMSVWEPATGTGTMADALERHTGRSVFRTDLCVSEAARVTTMLQSQDFLDARLPGRADAIVSNPPFGLGGRLAVGFIERSLHWLRDRSTPVRLAAFLLSVDFDSASGRKRLFRDCDEFTLKVVLLRRIKWFDGPSGPSTNHAWYVWQRCDTSTSREKRLAWAPTAATELSLGEL